MIPVRLKLRNFLSYQQEEIDFRPLRRGADGGTQSGVAVLCGRNGHGKSALLDAITWALWKGARGSVDDDVIHLAADDVAVELEFEVGRGERAERYVVHRKRTRGKSGALELFQVMADGSRVALSGSVMAETQAEITRRVRMDYATFLNSAFIAQGKADEFTKKTPAERKEVFRKILGLEQYQVWSDTARDRAKDAKARAQMLDQNVGAAQQELEELPGVEAEIASTKVDLDTAQAMRAQLDAEAAELRAAAAAYEQLREALSRAERRTEAIGTGIAARKRAVGKVEDDLAAARKLTADGDRIRADHESLLGLRRRDEELNALQGRAQELERLVSQAEQAVALERTKLEAERDRAIAETKKAELAMAELPALRERQAAIVSLETRASELEEASQARSAAESDARQRVAAARAEADGCKRQNRELKEKQDQLEGVAECPICRSPLSPDDVAHVRDEYSRLRRELGKQYEAANAAAEAAERDADAAKAEAAKLVASAKAARQEAERDRPRVLGAIGAAEQAEAALPAFRQRTEQLADVLDMEAFATELREKAAEARAALGALGYDGDAHAAVRAQVRAIAAVESEFRELLQAQEHAKSLAERLEREATELAREEAELRAADAECAEARAAIEGADDAGPRLRAAEDALAAARSAEQALAQRLGAREQRLEQLRQLRARVEEAVTRLAALREEEQLYTQLQKELGRDGVQAMLIDQHLPELELEANRRLDQMTGGRISLRIDTRKEKKGGPAETLDILISDDVGTRDYAMYSGGEAFRVDFALRIALARLLAAREGAELPTLIIDEGFGSQDQEGIDRLVEAIGAISRPPAEGHEAMEPFELILVVTHVEELRERFERRIEVVKDPVRGSQVRVV